MLQRKQTVFLIISILINCILMFVDLATFQHDASNYSINLLGLINTETNEVLATPIISLICLIICTLSAVVSVALYKKRTLQIKIVQLSLLLHAGFIASVFLGFDYLVNNTISEGITLDYTSETYSCIIPLVFFFSAIKLIKKDEALVRAADRIR